MRLLLLKIFLRAISGILVLSLLVLSIAYYLLNSTAGANFILSYLQDSLQETYAIQYSYERLDGTLNEGLDFSNLRITHPQFTLQSERLSSAWSLWPLLERRLVIQELQLSSPLLELPLADTTANSTENAEPPLQALQLAFQLPVELSLENLSLDTATLRQGEQRFQLEQLSFGLELNGQRLRLSNLKFAGYEALITGSLALQSNDFLLDGNLDWQLEGLALPAPITGDSLAGTLFFSGDIDTLDISHSLSQPFSIESEGMLLTGLSNDTGLNFSFEHLFDLSSLLEPQNFINGISGSLLTHGSPELLFLDANFTVQVLDLAPMTLLLAGEFAESLLSFETINLSSDELALQALAEISPQPFNMSMDWGLTRLDLDDYLQSISLQDVRAGGSLNLDAGGNSNISLSFLDARLNGYAMNASGLLELENGRLQDLDLNISTGSNQLLLNGTAAEELAIDWQLSAPDLSIVLPALSGQIFGSGRVEGAMPEPLIRGNLDGSSLAYENQAGNLLLDDFRVSFDAADGTLEAALDLGSLSASLNARDFVIDETVLDFNGSASAHQLSLALRSPQINLQADIQGSYENSNWEGSVDSAALSGNYGDWELEGPLSSSISSEMLSLSAHCWTYLQTGLCLEASLAESEYTVDLDIHALPLAYLNNDAIVIRVDDPLLNREYSGKPEALNQLQQDFILYLPQDTFLQGTLDATLLASGSIDALPESDFVLNLNSGELQWSLYRAIADERQSVQPDIRNFLINHQALQLSRSAGLLNGSGSLSIFQQDSGDLNAQGDIMASLSMGSDRSLGGSINIDVSSLDWLEALLPSLRNTRGSLNGNLALQGYLNDPVLLANLNIENASFDLPEYGIQAEQIKLNFLSNDRDTMQISASAVSGEGSLVLSGSANQIFDPQRTVTLALQGQNFSIINTLNTQMSVSPELALSLRDNTLDLQGTVLVPMLNIDLRNDEALLQNNSIDVTRDAVIISAPPAQAHLLQNQQQGIEEIPITTDLQLVLGNNVHFQGLSLDMFLDGRLQLQQERERPLLAYGDISISEGFYEIYGQRLDVSNGKLIFFGNPSNPALDIRAYRATADIQAGLQINGTLRNMNSRLFSTPSLPESEILAILITGKSYQDINNQDQSNLLGAIASLGINRGQGGITSMISSELGLDTVQINSQADLDQSSLGLGKYLTPDLFMHYEVGLFDKESVLSLDYILNERLRLEVQSGISQSIDMTYTVEK